MPEVRLIDANALYNDMKESAKAAREWKEEAQDEEIKIRAEQAHGTFCECALRVKNAPTIESEPWISCSERLPEIYQRVLTVDIDRKVTENFRCNIKSGELEWSRGFGITHWMPLPEPPEEVQE